MPLLWARILGNGISAAAVKSSWAGEADLSHLHDHGLRLGFSALLPVLVHLYRRQPASVFYRRHVRGGSLNVNRYGYPVVILKVITFLLGGSGSSSIMPITGAMITPDQNQIPHAPRPDPADSGGDLHSI